MPVIDLRSDTVTKPTDAMRAAMAAADVGDDVFGEDPTVNALEERAAELLGKEAGLFVSSGTMANLVSLMAHVPRGGEIIAGGDTHIVLDEAANHAVVVGASVAQLRDRPDGTLDLDEIRQAFRDPDDAHQPRTSLIVIENAHSHSMNQPLPSAYVAAVAAIAHEHGIPLHVDGARFFNATVALGVSPAKLAGPADSVAFCLSKALGCPVGSIVVGSRDFIGRAHRARKLLGGGMRQAGVLAAAGLVALETLVPRLAEDHANARLLGEGLARGRDVKLAPVETNIVVGVLEGRTAPEAVAALRDQGVLAAAMDAQTLRFTTHRDVSRADCERAAGIVEKVLG
jgi:threonine aldolase